MSFTLYDTSLPPPPIIPAPAYRAPVVIRSRSRSALRNRRPSASATGINRRQRSRTPRRSRVQVNKPDPLSKGLSEIFTALGNAISQPYFLMSLVITAVIIMLHGGLTPSITPGTPIHNALSNLDPENKFVKWVYANEIKVMAMFIFLPISVGAPNGHKATVLVLTTIWVALVPEGQIIQYGIQAALIYLAMHVRSRSAKWILILVGVLCYVFGWLLASATTVDPTTRVWTTTVCGNNCTNKGVGSFKCTFCTNAHPTSSYCCIGSGEPGYHCTNLPCE